MKLPHKFPVVEITWKDAVGRHRSMDPAEVGAKVELSEWTSVGYLVHQDEEKTVLYSDKDNDTDPEGNEGVRGENVIPTGWVKAIRYLRGGPRKVRPKKEVPRSAA